MHNHSRRYLLSMRYAVALLAACIGCGAAQAKTPPSQIPVTDSPEYWDQHTLTFAEVVPSTGADDNRVTVKLVEQFTDGKAPPTTFNLKGGEVWLEPWRSSEEAPLSFTSYDLVLLSSHKNGIGLVVYKLDGYPSHLAESCRLIVRLRGMKDMTEKLKLVTQAADAVAQRYVLHELKAATASYTHALVDQVKALRNDPLGEVEMRILAGSVQVDMDQALNRKNDDWDWLAGVLRQEKGHDGAYYGKLVERLITGHREARVQTIDLLCDLCNDTSRSAQLRCAITSANLRYFIDGGKQDDPGSIKIVEMLIDRIQDPSVWVRSSAGWNVWMLLQYMQSAKAKPETVTRLGNAAMKALQAASAKETQPSVKISLDGDIQRMEAILHPPVVKQ